MKFMKFLLANDVVAEIFAHCRNLFVASIFVVAGAYAVQSPHPSGGLLRLFATKTPAFVVLSFGLGLLVLNLVDGLYKLSKVRAAVVFEVCLLILYLFLALWLAQILTAFHLRA